MWWVVVDTIAEANNEGECATWQHPYIHMIWAVKFPFRTDLLSTPSIYNAGLHPQYADAGLECMVQRDDSVC